MHKVMRDRDQNILELLQIQFLCILKQKTLFGINNIRLILKKLLIVIINILMKLQASVIG